jgi:hypothetical protein
LPGHRSGARITLGGSRTVRRAALRQREPSNRNLIGCSRPWAAPTSILSQSQ